MTFQSQNFKQDPQYSQQIAQSLKTISQFMDKFNKLMNKQRDIQPQYELMATENDQESKLQSFLVSKMLSRPHPHVKIKNKLSTVYQESITHSQANLTGLIGSQCLQLAQKTALLQINQSNIPLLTKNSQTISVSSYICNGNVLKSLQDEKIKKQAKIDSYHPIMKKITGIRDSFKSDKHSMTASMKNSTHFDKANSQNYLFPKKIVKIKHKNKQNSNNSQQKKNVKIHLEKKQESKDQKKKVSHTICNQFYFVQLMKNPPKPSYQHKQRKTSLKQCLSRRIKERVQEPLQRRKRKGLSVTSMKQRSSLCCNSLQRNKNKNRSKSPSIHMTQRVIRFQKLPTHQQKYC